MTITLPTPLAGYYNRFDPALRYDEILIRAGKGVQGAEINEIQSTLIDRMSRIANAVFRDGFVIRGTPPTIDAATGQTVCPASAVYLRGAVREVPARTFTIATAGLVRIGIYLLEEVITELQDPTLRCPAPNTRNYNEPGGGRLRITPTWGREGEGLIGVFYPVWTVVDGQLLNQSGGDGGDAFSEALARYDRESNGNYIVDGLSVTALGLSGGGNAFSVKAGVGNIFGYKLDKPTATRLLYAEDPDLELVEAEPDTFTGTTGGTATIQLNRAPVSTINEVVITREKTVTITRGGFTGGQDALPDVSVLSIISVEQHPTIYQSPRDYFLNGDKVDWSPSGGGAIEPAPGSTYTVTYRYLGNVTPSNLDLQAGTFDVTGAVNGTLVLTDYQWKLPRYDRICIDRQGNFARVKGISSRFTPLPPSVASNLLVLATIRHRWGLTPEVENDGVRAIPFDQLEKMRSLIVDLFDLVAVERLRSDVSSREPSSKRGVFVDPFLDDDMRDQGIAQTAAIVDGTLQLPIAPTIYRAPDNNGQDWMLPYTEEIILEQGRVTGSSPINPYQAFDPIPAAVTLTPSVDRWTNIETIWSSPITQAFVFLFGAARVGLTTATTRTELLSESRRPAQFLRQITVSFVVDGFDPGEALTLLEFDGINVTPA
jgi:hypothetical protein